MIRDYSDKDIGISLITTSQVDLGARSLSSCLKEEGYNTNIGFFGSLGMRYGKKELESIVHWLKETNPELIGISSIELSREKTIQLIDTIRKETKIPVIAGGVDATFSPEFYLNHADYVIRGEGEYALSELADALLNGKEYENIRNLCYRDGGDPKTNPIRPLIHDLDGLPWEDWLDIQHHYTLANGKVKQKEKFVLDMSDHPILHKYSPSVFMFTSRGCAFNCDYCVNAKLRELNPGERYTRYRSVDPVIDRMKQIKEKDPSIKIVYFFDDDFFMRKDSEIEAFSEKWKKEIDLPFFAYASPLTLKESKLKSLIDAGLVVVNMGIQTGSERVNFDIYNRKMKNEKTINAARTLNKYIGNGRFGLEPPWYDFIINNPYETKEDILETIELFDKLPKPYDTFMHSLVFFSGTNLWNRAISDGIIKKKDESSKFDVQDNLKRLGQLEDESTKYNFHETIKQLSIKNRNKEHYLNSLLYWMDGRHTNGRYGLVPAGLVDYLTNSRTIEFFEKHPAIISAINYFLPTGKRTYFLKQELKDSLSKVMEMF